MGVAKNEADHGESKREKMERNVRKKRKMSEQSEKKNWLNRSAIITELSVCGDRFETKRNRI